MTHLNEKHLTLVCYKSGYGGDFFCALLDEALGNQSFDVRDANNRYWGRNYPFSFVNEHVKSLHHIFSYYKKEQSFLLINELSEKVDWARSIKNIVEICYDEDESEFVNNLIQLISFNLNLPYKYNVANLHYMGEYDKFDVRKLHSPNLVLSLKTKNPLYYQYFHALSAIKTNFYILKNTSLKQKEFFDEKNILYAHEIDVGNLFFTDEIDEKVSEELSYLLRVKIKFNKNELKDYKVKNKKILTKYFGEDFESMNSSEFREKKLKLFDMVKRGEIN